jgi:hypothetical protein
LKEFDELRSPPVSRRGYHSKFKISCYKRNLGVILCRYRAISTFVIKTILAFRASLDYRSYKIDLLMKKFNKAKKELKTTDCKKKGTTWK